MTFREKLLEMRRRDGITQTALAKAVGVTRQAVYLWEKGLSYPDAAALLSLRRLFGVSIDVLLDDALPLPEGRANERATPYAPVPKAAPEERLAPEKPKTPSRKVEKPDVPAESGEQKPDESTPEKAAPLRAKVEPSRVKTGNILDLFGSFFKKKK